MKRFRELFESPPGLTKPGEQSFTKSEHGPKKKKISEQHREEGRFKPTIPRYVKSKGVGPRPTIDSAKVKLKENFGKPTPSAEEVAKKHGVSVDEINKQLEMGIKIEHEHTGDAKMAREIALDHLNEKPNYYSKLKKYVEGVEPDAQSIAARTYNERPQKEPMKSYKQFHKEEVEEPPIHVRSMYTRHYAKHGGTISKAKEASAKAYDAVEKMHGKEMRNKLEAFHRKNMNEEVEQLDELSKEKLNKYVTKAIKQHPASPEHNPENKKTTQRVSGLRRATSRLYKESERIEEGENPQVKGGDPCWKGYQMVGMKKKGGRKVPNCVPEEVEHLDEMDKSQPSSDRGGESSGNPWAKGSKATPITAKKAKTNFLSVLNKSIDKSNKAKQDTATKVAKHKMKEEVEQIDELSNELLGRYKDAAVVSHNKAEAEKNYKLSDKRFSGVVKATNKQFDNMRKKPFGEEKEPPFEPTRTKEKVIPGKLGKGYSTARHLARQALKKQVEKMKPMKESLEESRKAEIVKEIVKKKKKEKSASEDQFQKEPMLSNEISKI